MRFILSLSKAAQGTLLAAIFWALAQAAGAAELDLYRGTVPVADQSPEQRQLAIREALNQVLIRVSGRRQAPSIADTASDELQIERYIQRSQYLRTYNYPELTSLSELPQKEPRLELSVVFAQDFVESLLTRNNLPLWDRSRSEVLLWLVVDTPEGPAMIIDENNPALELLRASSERRGVPLMLPLMDLDDQIHFNAPTAWAAHRGSFRLASQRYGSEATLLGRLETPFPGLWQARWSLLKSGRITEWSSRGSDLDAVLAGGVDRVADELGREYGVYVSAADQNEVILTVSGISDLAAYDRVMDYVSELTVVTQAAPVELQADRMQVALSLRGGRQTLVQLLNRGGVLERDPQALGVNDLRYQLRP